MKLKKARLHNYRCIEDTGDFEIDPITTCLVGKNEAGKTALLTALYRLNPHIASENKFDRERDYPRRHLMDYEERHSNGPARVLSTAWTLDDTDKEALTELLGPIGSHSMGFELDKHYEPAKLTWGFDLNEKEVVAHYLNTSTLHEEERKSLEDAKDIGDLRSRVADGQSERHQKLRDTLAQKFKEGNAWNAAVALLGERLPKFLYFSQYDTMPGEVALDALQKRQTDNSLTKADQAFLAFCDLVGTPLKDIASINKFETLIAKFEGASNKISGEIFRYWSQNKHLKVQFRRDKAEPGDPVPFNSGYIFRTRIFNTLHEVTVPFSDRSAGFVWFFSFLVVFSQVKKKYGNNLLILLDEPGLNLHAKAQADLLRYFKERLAPHHQVLYTTHSPFMVPSDNLLSVRTVEDVVIEKPGEMPEILGTKVGSDPLAVGRDTLFPLQGALGYEITQTLFVGKNNLVVEGPSDLLYLTLFSETLRSTRRTSLDQRWTICPVGGIDKVSAFMSLFGAGNLRIAVLVDVATGQKKKVDELDRLTKVLKTGKVLKTAAYAGQAEADVEDIIGAEPYIALINIMYNLVAPHSLVLPPDRPERITKFVEDRIRLLPQVPEYDHYRPAEYFMLHRTEVLSQLPGIEQALDRFEELFKDLNSFLD